MPSLMPENVSKCISSCYLSSSIRLCLVYCIIMMMKWYLSIIKVRFFKIINPNYDPLVKWFYLGDKSRPSMEFNHQVVIGSMVSFFTSLNFHAKCCNYTPDKVPSSPQFTSKVIQSQLSQKCQVSSIWWLLEANERRWYVATKEAGSRLDPGSPMGKANPDLDCIGIAAMVEVKYQPNP